MFSMVKICNRHHFYLWFRFAFMRKHYYVCWIFFFKTRLNKADNVLNVCFFSFPECKMFNAALMQNNSREYYVVTFLCYLKQSQLSYREKLSQCILMLPLFAFYHFSSFTSLSFFWSCTPHFSTVHGLMNAVL